MENKKMNDLELKDDELDSVAGGVSREVPKSGICPKCGQRMRPVMAPLGTNVTVPKGVCNSCGYAE